jgi:hypothetical protein
MYLRILAHDYYPYFDINMNVYRSILTNNLLTNYRIVLKLNMNIKPIEATSSFYLPPLTVQKWQPR